MGNFLISPLIAAEMVRRARGDRQACLPLDDLPRPTKQSLIRADESVDYLRNAMSASADAGDPLPFSGCLRSDAATMAAASAQGLSREWVFTGAQCLALSPTDVAAVLSVALRFGSPLSIETGEGDNWKELLACPFVSSILAGIVSGKDWVARVSPLSDVVFSEIARRVDGRPLKIDRKISRKTQISKAVAKSIDVQWGDLWWEKFPSLQDAVAVRFSCGIHPQR